MNGTLVTATGFAVAVIDRVTLIIIILGAADAFVCGVRGMLGSGDGHTRPDAWLALVSDSLQR